MADLTEPYEPPTEIAQVPTPEAFATPSTALGAGVAPAPAANPYAAAVADLGRIEGQQAATSILAAKGSNPDTTARAVKISQSLGVPVDVAERNLADFEAIDNVNKYTRTLNESPTLRRWMKEPVNARLATEIDMPKLAGIERLWVGGVDLARSLPAGAVEFVGSSLSGIGAGYRAVGELGMAGVEAIAGRPVRTFHLPWYLTPSDIVSLPGETIKRAAEAIDVPPERRTFGTDVAKGVGQIGGQIAAIMATGGGASLAMLFGQGVDQMADDVKKAGKAGTVAGNLTLLAGGGVTAISEKIGLDLLLDRVPPAIKSNILRKITDIAIAGGIEATEEAVEQVAQNAIANYYLGTSKPLTEGIVEQSSVAGTSAAIVRAMFGARFRRGGRGDTEQPKADADLLDRILGGARETDLIKRSPEKLAEYLAGLPPGNVFVPAEAVRSYFQKLEPDEAAALAGKLGITGQVEQAMASGGDVVIALNDYVAHAPEDMTKAWREEVRLRSSGMSLKEAQEFEKTGGKELGAIISKRLEEATKLDAARQQVVAEAERIFQSAGEPPTVARELAGIYGERYVTRAQRSGLTADDAAKAFARSGLEVRSDLFPPTPETDQVPEIPDAIAEARALVAGEKAAAPAVAPAPVAAAEPKPAATAPPTPPVAAPPEPAPAAPVEKPAFAIDRVTSLPTMSDERHNGLFKGFASTNEGGRLSVHAFGSTAAEAQKNAVERLKTEFEARAAKRATQPAPTPAAPPAPQEAAAPQPAATTPAGNPDHQFAEAVADLLDNGDRGGERVVFPARAIQELANRIYGGTLAEGKYSRDQVYDAMELGVNLYIQRHPERYGPSVDAAEAKARADLLERVKDTLPTQTVRAGEKDAYQQFSTPPDYAFAAAWVANPQPTDSVLEPSAGLGGLLVHTMNAGVAETTANELSDKRRGMIVALHPTRVTAEDAAQIDNVLPAEVKPTLVLMNPPFSRSAERMGSRMVLDEGAKHIEQALARLEPGGRLVAIVGDSMKPVGTAAVGTRNQGTGAAFRGWWERIGAQYDVRANIGVDRDIYKKYGTSFPTRLLVIDKNPPSGRALVTGQASDAADIIERLAEIRNDRATGPVQQQPAQPAGPALAGPGQGGEQRPGELPRPTGGLGAGEDGGAAAQAELAASAGPPRPDIGDRGDLGGGARGGDGVVPVQPEHIAGGRGSQPAAVAAGLADAPGSRASSAGDDIRHDVGVEHASVAQAAAALPLPDNPEAIYEAYRPQRVQIKGAKAHPGALVQSSAMASVVPPATDYKPRLPAELIKSGALSDAQLEAIVYAGNAHSDVMPNGNRRGFFIGDGTGVGKGREIAGILLDNKLQGRSKAIWVSEKPALINDAKRDWAGLGQPPGEIIDISKTKAGGEIAGDKGILFVSYDTLKSAEKTKAEEGTVKGKTRVDQIVEWLGPDFDGVIAFDEAHNLGNSNDQKDTRGTKKAALKALAGVELQSKLPNARVIYVSATGATEVSNLAFADRLGLWGEGTAFASREDFVSRIGEGGVAAMELVARDMKALGHYIARNLSYDGVDYDRVEHTLNPDQRATYDKLAEGWQLVLQNFEAALEATGATKNGKSTGSRAKSNALGAFWGGHQRFFNQVITSMQMPSVIRGVEEDLAAGRQAVLQLVNTNEAAQERALTKAKASGSDDIEDLDMTPRDQLMQMVEKSFPVQQMEEYVDDNKNLKSRPAVDSQGNPILNRQAVAARERLLDELGSLRVPDGPLEMVLNHFGPDKVAEVTGRGQRVVRKPDDKGQIRAQVEKRGAQANVADANAFQAGNKPILVFSEAGGTGRSYHAAIGSGAEKARRSHYLVQGGWRADKAVQGFGRTHRTSQASAPLFHLVTTDLQGQKRFISSIARRLGQLGALTKGERRTGDQGLFGARDNLESAEAKAALAQFFRDALAGELEGVTVDDLEKGMGLKLRDKDGNQGPALTLPPMSTFLNRILSLTVERQNQVFQAFSDRLDGVIERATAEGTLDTGVESYKADRITKQSEQVVYTDPRSGAETRHVHLITEHKNHPVSFAATMAGRNKTGGRVPESFVQNIRSGNVFAVTPAANKTDADGRVTSQVRLTSPVDYQIVDEDDLTRGQHTVARYKRLGPEEAGTLWDAQVAATPEFRKSDLHVITGAVLPIWDRLGGNPKIYRLQTDAGERMLARVIPALQVEATLERLGAEATKVTAPPTEIAERILAGGTAKLANDWTIKLSRVAGEPRIELIGPDFRYREELERHGVFSERIQNKVRWFIPTEPARAAAAIEGITRSRPVTSLSSSYNQSASDADQAARDPAATNAEAVASTLGSTSENDDENLKIVPAEGQSSVSATTRYEQDDTDEGTVRGNITFTQTATQTAAGEMSALMRLLGDRNLSTALHETGHLWLEELHIDARQSYAPQQLKDDLRIVRDYLGAEGDAPLTVAQHEKWARTTEAYFMEGKSPSVAMSGVMARFKAWLVSIYKTALALRVDINDDVRGVLDRLIATDDAIAEMQSEIGARQLSQDQLGMTDAEYKAYTDSVIRTRDKAEQTLLDKLTAQIRRKRTAQWNTEREAVRDEVRGTVDTQPDLVAYEYLRSGRVPDSLAHLRALPRLRLGREGLIEEYGDPAIVDALPRTVPPLVSERGGARPGEIAELLGFPDGRAMIDAVVRLGEQRDALKAAGDPRSVRVSRIDAEVDRIMAERHGDPLADGSIEDEALAALHNEARADVLAAEVRGLARQTGKPATPYALAKQWAERSIAEKPIWQISDLSQFTRAEAKAARRAEQAMIKGDADEALRAKQEQMIAHALWLAARDANEEIESNRARMEVLAGQRTIRSMDQGYLEKIHDLLERFNLKPRSMARTERLESLREWAIAQQAAGNDVAVPQKLLDEAFAIDWRRMTVEEFRGLSDSVKQLAHLGRLKQKFLDGKDKREFEAVVAEAVAAAGQGRQSGDTTIDAGKTNFQRRFGRIASGLRSIDSALLKVEYIFKWLDGGDSGPFGRLFERMSRAQADERTQWKDMGGRLRELFHGLPVETRRRMQDVAVYPELNGESLRRDALIAVALNMGNEGNKTKLLKGKGWTEQGVLAAIDRGLDAREMAFVQDIWDLIETLWPQIAAMERELNGVEPEKVVATPLTTRHGTFRGGYYPLVYDPKRAAEAGDRRVDEFGENFSTDLYTRATTPHGFTKERVERFARPIHLSLDVIPRHIMEVIHDLHWRPPIMDAQRFLGDARVKNAIREKLGREYEAQLNPWLTHMALEYARDRRGMSAWDDFMKGLRSNVTMVGMGYRLTTVLAQIGGYSDSTAELGTYWMASGFKAYAAQPLASAAFVRARSGEMAHRADNLDRDIRQVIRELAGKDTILADVRSFAFSGIAWADAAVTVPTWLGAYNKAQHDGRTEAEAIAYADKQVRLSQGAGGTKDLVRVQRDSEAMKLFTMFYSYFSHYYNAQRDVGRRFRDARTPGDFGEALARAFWLNGPGVLAAAFLSGQGPGDDESWGAWAARVLFFNLFLGIPIVRDLANLASNAVAGKYIGGYQLSPAAQAVETVGKLALSDIPRIAQGEEASRMVTHAINAAGYGLGLPTGQLATTTQFLYDALVAGSQNPETARDWLSGLAYGAKRH